MMSARRARSSSHTSQMEPLSLIHIYILAMARHISDLGIPLWIRHVLVPGLTDDEEGLRRTADFIRSLKTVQRVEVLPYHTLGPVSYTHLRTLFWRKTPPKAVFSSFFARRSVLYYTCIGMCFVYAC